LPLSEDAEIFQVSILVDWETPTIKELANGANLNYYNDLNYTDYHRQNKLPGWNLPKVYDRTNPTANDFHPSSAKE
jgi:hypothetical protein